MAHHPELGFAHRFIPAPASTERRDGPGGAVSPTLLLLHGTGGDEDDLLPLGRALAPDAALLSPRGKAMEGIMPRFFRRLAEGVFDEADLIERTHELARFVEEAAGAYGFDAKRVIAVGYSNGANIAASLLLLRPDTLAAAILFHAMVPLRPSSPPDLAGKPVFIAAGRADPIVPPRGTEGLAELLRACGADVTLRWEQGGHALSGPEVEAAREWISRRLVQAA